MSRLERLFIGGVLLLAGAVLVVVLGTLGVEIPFVAGGLGGGRSAEPSAFRREPPPLPDEAAAAEEDGLLAELRAREFAGVDPGIGGWPAMPSGPGDAAGRAGDAGADPSRANPAREASAASAGRDPLVDALKAKTDLADPAQLMAFLIGTFTVNGTKLGPEDLDFLFEALAVQEDWGVRNLLLSHLERIGGKGVTNGVLAFLATENDPAAVVRALRTLRELNDPAAVAGLVEALAGSSNRKVRDAAFHHLLEAGNPAATKPLLAALGRSSDPVLERYALAALSQIGGAEGVETVLDYALSGDPARQALGLKSLRDVKDPAAVPALSDALARAGPPAVRGQVIRTLGRTRSPEAVAPLARAATADPDRRIRLEAIRGLVQVGSPDAIPALGSIVAGGDRVEASAAERAIQAIERQSARRR